MDYSDVLFCAIAIAVIVRTAFAQGAVDDILYALAIAVSAFVARLAIPLVLVLDDDSLWYASGKREHDVVAAVVLSITALCVGVLLYRREYVRPQPGIKARVKALYVFPVKSCAGISVDEAAMGVGGLEGDREWMIVRAPTPPEEPRARMLTIREYPRLVLLQPSFAPSGNLVLTAPDGRSVEVVSPGAPRECEVLVWRTVCRGLDQGAEVARFLATYLGVGEEAGGGVRLLRMPDALATATLADCSKYVHVPTVAGRADRGGARKFSDWAPLNLVSTASLQWLNEHSRTRHPWWGAGAGEAGEYTPEHFRANILVEEAEGARRPLRPFEEDAWQEYVVGGVDLDFLKTTGRCMVPCTDPRTGERHPRAEPLLTLRRRRGGVYPFLPPGHASQHTREAFFAVAARHYFRPGQRMRVGDPIEVSAFRNPKLQPKP